MPDVVPQSSGLRILVVDDDRDACAVLKTAVQALGHVCTIAHDGESAWAAIAEFGFDVVVSDWAMPCVDGVELCRRVRDISEPRYTYFIFMTGFTDRDHFLTGMRAGADDYIAKPIDLDELEARLIAAERVLKLHRRLAHANTRLQRDSERSFRAARTDALTEVGNRRRLEEDLDGLLAQASRYSHRYCIAIFDIDFFKQYNDRFGHILGDDVLRRVADTARNQLRRGDTVYRYGGEEFVVILPEQSLAEARIAMERVRTAVENLQIPSGTSSDAGQSVVTVSVGLAELADHSQASELPTDWIRRADAALYAAKANGRNRVEIAIPTPADSGSKVSTLARMA